MSSRRQFLLGSASLGLLGLSEPVFARPKARFVLLILRGGLDGLSTLVPYGDPHHAQARGDAAVSEFFDLDGFFGLHESLDPIRPLWRRGELLPVHAVGLPYRERSHFDAQDLLENGTSSPNGARDGWLDRALRITGLSGGRVLCDWPGLDELYEGRDLRATTDVRGLFKGVLRDHLGVAVSDLDEVVFPDSEAVRPVTLG